MDCQGGVTSPPSILEISKLKRENQALKELIGQITLEMSLSYGYRRIALALGVNHKRTFRVMKIFGIRSYRRRGKKFRKAKDNARIYPNLIQQMEFPVKTNTIWVSDFTQWPFHGRTIYLATIMDVSNRKIVGWNLPNSHAIQLTLTALMNAIEKYGRPEILHSDQGSEY